MEVADDDPPDRGTADTPTRTIRAPRRSVWSFPRPAIAEPTSARVVIEHHGLVVADTVAAVMTLETSHPPSYYLPMTDVAEGALRRAAGSSFCEWKGVAEYWDVVVGGETLARAAWSYPEPAAPFAALRGKVAFYAGPFDRCSVDGEAVVPQPGGFYGGWITSDLDGPYKGVPGSTGW